ncbi:MAG: rhodanese-like domain-containing protein [Gemmataceae bacterium]
MIHQMSVNDLKARLDAGEQVYLVDVRNENEWAYCHLPGAVHLPLGELSQRLEEVVPPPNATLVVYCHHGVRSLSGAAILQQAGHPNAMSLQGGIEAWSLLIDPTVPRY